MKLFFEADGAKLYIKEKHILTFLFFSSKILEKNSEKI